MDTCDRYDNLIWLSYAKNRLDALVAAEMKSHAVSCSECGNRLDFAHKVAAIADLQSGEPPESWTEEAAAQFESVKRSQESADIFGELVFDSYFHDREAVRSRSMDVRHLTFALPEFDMDLVMEYSGRQLELLVGHLLPKTAEPSEAFDGFDLELRIAEGMRSAKPNRFGEFSFIVDSQMTGEPLELRCTSKEGRCAIVLIPC